MSDGKSSSNNGENEANTKLGSKLGARFRAPGTGSLEMPGHIPEDDDAINNVAKRFRAGGSFKNATMGSATSLDQDQGANPSKSMGGDDLADFLLDALDAEPEPTPAVPPEAQPELDDDDFEELDTQRVDSAQIERHPELPLVEVEPLSLVLEVPKDLNCPSCGGSNPAGMRFCVQCGGTLAPTPTGSSPAVGAARVLPTPSSVSEAALLDNPSRPASPSQPNPIVTDVQREPPPPSNAARQENPWPVRLISINEDGTDGTSVSLDFLETTVGRDGDQHFPTDAFLSPKHARFHIDQGEVSIEDLYSLNGTFVKLRDETRLTPGDTILMGRQVLRFERFEQSITSKTKSSDGTRYMGSPAPGGEFKILQVGIGGILQNVYCLPETGAVLGREKGDIVFPHDKFMSGRHAQIYVGDDANCYLVDLNSSNGTWIKIGEKTRLNHKDYIFMGQQLFRVHYENTKR